MTINANLSQPCAVHTRDMPWSASPSGSVWRKRMHLAGAVESGQVTSVVRYDSNARFPAHDHPEGEEILVLQGVFSDEQGDWPEGSYLLNPEGFRHAPFSVPGCVIMVKLRQYPGQHRDHVALNFHELPWQSTGNPRITVRNLYHQDGYTDRMYLQCWDADSDPLCFDYPSGVEIFVLSGSFEDASGKFEQGSWLRLPPGSTHTPRITSACTVYVKTGGFTYLHDMID